MRATAFAFFVAFTLTAASLAQPPPPPPQPPPPIDPAVKPSLDAITPDGLLAHIKVLSSDEFEGRAPGSHGEELSVQYLTSEMRKLNLAPGNPDGSYVQEVPLAGILSAPQASFSVKG